jgi:hypothetical protein
MRIVGLVAAVAALFVSSAALAQDWGEYANREDFFQINLPDDPMETTAPYKTVKGTDLTAHIYTAKAPADTLLAGTYSVTVVDYTNAKDEIPDAIEQARQDLLKKGEAKYDAIGNIDMHRARYMSVESATDRYLASILVAANNRLYIVLADTPLSSAVPAQFQASIQILDANGVRIRTRTAPGAPQNEVAPVGAAANAAEEKAVQTAVSGTWRNPSGGTCEAAYFKSGERTQTVRKEEALAGTVTNMGITIQGQLILSGAREGQFVDPMTDKAIFLFENKPGDKLNFFAVGAPALGWPEVTLERCPGSRG